MGQPYRDSLTIRPFHLRIYDLFIVYLIFSSIRKNKPLFSFGFCLPCLTHNPAYKFVIKHCCVLSSSNLVMLVNKLLLLLLCDQICM